MEWKKVYKEHLELFVAYIKWRLRVFGAFNVNDILSDIEQMMPIVFSSMQELPLKIVAILFDFLINAGYIEKAIVLANSLLFYNQNEFKSLQGFEFEFNFNPTLISQDPNSADDLDRSSIDKWISVEMHRQKSAWKLEINEDDPHAIVLFSDISNFLFKFPSEDTLYKIRVLSYFIQSILQCPSNPLLGQEDSLIFHAQYLHGYLHWLPFEYMKSKINLLLLHENQRNHALSFIKEIFLCTLQQTSHEAMISCRWSIFISSYFPDLTEFIVNTLQTINNSKAKLLLAEVLSSEIVFENYCKEITIDQNSSEIILRYILFHLFKQNNAMKTKELVSKYYSLMSSKDNSTELTKIFDIVYSSLTTSYKYFSSSNDDPSMRVIYSYLNPKSIGSVPLKYDRASLYLLDYFFEYKVIRGNMSVFHFREFIFKADDAIKVYALKSLILEYFPFFKREAQNILIKVAEDASNLSIQNCYQILEYYKEQPLLFKRLYYDFLRKFSCCKGI